MMIAISATGPTPDSPMDPHFGRAACFVVHDLQTGKSTCLKPETQNMAQGAGIHAAQLVSDSQATAVLTGHCGPKAFQALTQAGITVYLCEGDLTVARAITLFAQGALKPLDKPAGGPR